MNICVPMTKLCQILMLGHINVRAFLFPNK